jgi:hypothetical protein
MAADADIGSDVPLLEAYAMACVRMSSAPSRKKIAELDRAARLAMSLATKLRLPPSSSIDPQALGRRKADARPFSYYETRAMEDSDE